ncbi:MAG: phosphoribosylformylglycinamidine synthase subunit PurS [Synergistaceae bacterium]|jgi:phosphoribosylformylglycinamidine synthase|nr:phosphoribosylformylglycinamidine synthase subunit PurS [Synergistaceae bacterium]
MFRVKVTVMLKRSVLDPQGAALERALNACRDDALSFSEVSSVRVGKVIEMTCDGNDAESVKERMHSLADRILANPVMEEYTVSVESLS